MSNDIRLGGTLHFSESEKYLADKIKEFNSSRDITKFIEHFIRLAFDSPDSFKREEDFEKAMSFLDKHGVTKGYADYIAGVRKELSEMRKMVEEVHSMCLDMYTLSKVSKTIGLEDKSKNTAKANFLVEKQLNDLTRKLGLDSYMITSQSDTELEDSAERALEYIITRYSNIIDGLKSDVQVAQVPVQQVAQMQQMQVQQVVTPVQQVQQVVAVPIQVQQAPHFETQVETPTQTIEEESSQPEENNNTIDDDAIINYGDDDFGDDDMFKPMSMPTGLQNYDKLFKNS